MIYSTEILSETESVRQRKFLVSLLMDKLGKNCNDGTRLNCFSSSSKDATLKLSIIFRFLIFTIFICSEQRLPTSATLAHSNAIFLWDQQWSVKRLYAWSKALSSHHCKVLLTYLTGWLYLLGMAGQRCLMYYSSTYMIHVFLSTVFFSTKDKNNQIKTVSTEIKE